MSNRIPVSAVASPLVENLDERKLMTAAYDIGINANDGASASFAKAAPTLKALGVKSVRLWTTVSDFNDHSWNGVLSRATLASPSWIRGDASMQYDALVWSSPRAPVHAADTHRSSAPREYAT